MAIQIIFYVMKSGRWTSVLYLRLVKPVTSLEIVRVLEHCVLMDHVTTNKSMLNKPMAYLTSLGYERPRFLDQYTPIHQQCDRVTWLV